MPGPPMVVATRHLLSLDDDVTPLRSMGGGNIRADVVAVNQGHER